MLYISAVIVVEFGLDIERVAEPGRRTERNDRRTLSARPMFERRALPVSEGKMHERRLPIGEGRKTGHDFSQPDRMIGGSAPEFGPAVVSSVTSDYEKVRLPAATAWPAAAWL
jgi:hypothetical protein